jgi:excisionase family DNA binding protein
MMTTADAAIELEIKPDSVKKLCQRGVLPATKVGRDWLIDRNDLDQYKLIRRTPGQPRKVQ